MILDIHWIILVIFTPIFGSAACFLWPKRNVLIALVTAIITVISVALLTWQVVEQGSALRYALGGWNAPLGIDLYADGLSLIMLIVTAVVGLAINSYSACYFKGNKAKYFWPLWLFLWSALNGLFLSADVFNIFVTLELIGLAAVAMVALSGGTKAITAAMRYLLVSLLGSMFYLMGVALLYHTYGTVDISIISQSSESSQIMWITMGLMITGLLIKTALFPLHFWLPTAHSSAPAPVSALLSALVVKASFYILIRLWMEVFPSEDLTWIGKILGALGVAAILWGGIQALRQERLKLLIAYSTVMQIGYLFLAFPLASVIGWKAALYFVIAHAIAKTAMFLAAGNILFYDGHDRIVDLDRIAQRLPLTLAAFGLAGISLMGLPPSGGFIAKWLMLDASFSSGQWWWGLALIAGGLMTGAYVFKVIGHAFTQAEPSNVSGHVSKRMEWTALVMAMLAIALSFMAMPLLELMDIGSPLKEAMP